MALGMTVRRMLAELTAADIAEYMAFERLEPFGEVRADLRAGIVASTVANHSMSPPREAARPMDFMPMQQRREQAIAVADPVAHGQLLAQTIFGNRIKKG